MWSNYVQAVSFETAIKLTPQCASLPTLCWLFLKVFEWSNQGIFWYTLATIVSVVVTIKMWARHRRMREIYEANGEVEEKGSNLRFEQSLSNLLERSVHVDSPEQILELPNSQGIGATIAPAGQSSSSNGMKPKPEVKSNNRIPAELPDTSGQKKVPKRRA